MEYQIIKPSPILAPFIKHYWILEVNKVNPNADKQRIFPHGFIEITFTYGDKMIRYNSDNNIETLGNTIINGQKKDYYDVKPDGKIGMVSVLLKPEGSMVFFKLPLDEIADKSIDLEIISGKETIEIEDKIDNAKNNIERISIIEDYLIKKIKIKDKYDFERISGSIKKINCKLGQISVSELADYVCLSNKQFERKFTAFVGIKPKQFIKTVRFQSAIHSLQLNPSASFTETAYKCGYYDQSHLNNEFKSFTGFTPKEYTALCIPYSDYFS